MTIVHSQTEASARRICCGYWFVILILAALPFCRPAHAQQYSPTDAYNILTQSDHVGFCNPQAGSYYPLWFNVGCCGGPGWRVCPSVLHFGKGSWGASAGCTDPESNQISGAHCELPSPPPIPANILPSGRPYPLGTNINFLVTSDLHFYRTTYNVMDQTSHPSSMMAWSLLDSQIQSGAPSPNKYGAILIAGDMSTGAVDAGYYNQDYRISGYRMMWENNWPSQLGYLPGASVGLPVFPTLGNHDFNDATWWSYMGTLTQNMHRDSNITGCLPEVTPGCVDMGGLAGTLNYSFDWEGVHFLMLNTWAGDTNTSSIGSNGLAWMQNDLQHYVGSSGKPVVVVQHYGLDANSVSGGPLTDVNGQAVWWTAADITAFENAIKPYNVVGMFTGHTHDLAMNYAQNAVNGSNNNALDSHGIQFGATLDNFDDGSGGDCSKHGVGSVYTPSGDPAGATFCSDATKSFLAVHIDNQYMEVRTISYSDMQNAYLDGSIGLVGESASDTASCKKWIGGAFQDVTSRATIAVDSNNNVTVLPAGSASSISGPLALWIDSGDLTQWDFVDSCDPVTAHKFVMLTSGALQSSQPLSVKLNSPGYIARANVHLFQLAPQFTVSPAQPSIGTTPTTVTISSSNGAPVNFNLAVDGGDASYTTKWLQATTSPDNQSFTASTVFTTPQSFNFSAMDIDYRTVGQLFQNIYITDPAGHAGPLNVYMLLAAPVLNLVSNATGAQATIYKSSVTLPASYTGAQQGGEDVPLSVMSPQFPSTGTRLVFQQWSDGGAQAHNFLLGCCGADSNLTVDFETDYLVSPIIAGGGTLRILPTSPDGYYRSGANLDITAMPDANYYFTGYSNGIVSSESHTAGAVTGPLSFTATFAKEPQLTFATNVPSGSGSTISVQTQTQKVPFSEYLLPNASIAVSVPASFISTVNPGIQYVFLNWSDGATMPSRTVIVPTSDATYQANYGTQVLVTLSATSGGAVTGGGWYNANSSVTLTATPAPGFYFAGFSGDLSSGSNPWNVVVATAPLKITATFLPIPSVTVASVPSNQTIYIDNVAYLTPHVFSWLPGETHALDATKTSPPASVRLSFTGWSDAQAAIHQITAPSNNETLTATFTTSYLLSLSTSGSGSISAVPGSPTLDGYYPSSTRVALTAVPAAGSYFVAFSGALAGTVNPQTVAMTAPLTVQAAFAPMPQVSAGVSAIADSDPNTVQLTLALNNSGLGNAAGLSIVSVTTADLTGTGAVTVTGLPTSPIALGGGQSTTVTLSVAWPSTARRVQLKLQWTANAGAYSGSQSISLFR